MSRMFPNQVNFKELFSNPGAYLSNRAGDQYDSQSNSQLPYSQVDFPDSQEQSSQGSQSSSPGKKFYSRYGGSRSLTRQNSQENLRAHLSTAVKLTNQQLQNNIARAKERDERDILNTILGSVRDTSTEVLSAITAVKESLQKSEKATDGQIEGCFHKIQDVVQTCYKEMWKALEVKEHHKEELINLRQDLLQRDTRIAYLEDQIVATKEESNQKLIDKLTQISEAQHKKTQEKVKELFNILKQDLKDYAERQHEHQLNGLKDTQQHIRELGKLQENQLKDNNSKLGQKIQQIIQQSRTASEKVGKEIKENLKNSQKQLKTDFDKLLEKQLKHLAIKKKKVPTATLR